MIPVHDDHLGKKIRQYTFIKLLGKGSFGSVYLVQDQKNKCLAACKAIDKKIILNHPKIRQLINNEICVLFNCQDQNVVSYLTSFENENYVYILMEYCNGGDVDVYVKKKGGKLDESQAKQILKQIVKGFISIRSIDAVHRDFKLQNLLMNNGIVKIADLGFAKVLRQQKQTSTVLGTLYTMAPEIIQKKPYGYQCDIWSIGIVYYKMLFGRYPYTGKNYAQMLKKIKNQPLQYDKQIKVSNQSKDFINCCLVVDPNQRITWEEIQNHPLIKNDLLNNPSIQLVNQNITIPDLNRNEFPRIKQLYIRNCPILHIQNSSQFPDANFNSQIAKQRMETPINAKGSPSIIFSYYQQIYLAIRQYILSGVSRCILPILGLDSVFSIDYSMTGYIISKQRNKQIQQLKQSLRMKQNILDLNGSVTQFFQSQQCKLLIKILIRDQADMIGYVNQFSSKLKKQDIQKLQISQKNSVNNVLTRQKRYLLQYSVQLFNNLQRVDRATVLNILKLIFFLNDQIRCFYKSVELYDQFGVSISLENMWYAIKGKLQQLKMQIK